ncbi:hypothetical protein MANES_02G024700v8 [Manihot esculenta]|uniref:DUF4378 domain-containing protein n=1 Tax=Manihot esculenta TaxID=3983 RepID=A0A2C9WAA9_MANES|nr:hypothetical protein MANES_02G024700v8 [Manihot esculenta]
MRIPIPTPRLAFLVLLIILALSQVSSCRHLHINKGDQTSEQTAKPVFFPFSWHFPAKAPQGSGKEKISSVYGVSYKRVPGGPNPLHN